MISAERPESNCTFETKFADTCHRGAVVEAPDGETPLLPKTRLSGLTAPLCWVDAGTGRAFYGAFPMTGFDIAHPSGAPLVEHQEWLLERLNEMQDIALGERRSREWEVLIVVPLLDKDSREWDHGDYSGWNKLTCYGAYSSSGGVAPIPLRSWAEGACAPRNGSGVS